MKRTPPPPSPSAPPFPHSPSYYTRTTQKYCTGNLVRLGSAVSKSLLWQVETHTRALTPAPSPRIPSAPPPHETHTRHNKTRDLTNTDHRFITFVVFFPRINGSTSAYLASTVVPAQHGGQLKKIGHSP